jgi:phospholipase C
VAQVLNIVVSNPGLWEKTAIIVSYDENGGFFDHVPPPTAPPGTHGEHLTMDKLPKDAGGVRGPIGLGFRVPGLVLSPYARGGFISSQVFDHTSQLLFLEKRFGVDVPHLTKWRRKTVGDMTSAFSFGRRPHHGVPEMPGLTGEQLTILGTECVANLNGPTGVADFGAKTPIPHHVPAPRQRKGKPRRPIHRHHREHGEQA